MKAARLEAVFSVFRIAACASEIGGHLGIFTLRPARVKYIVSEIGCADESLFGSRSRTPAARARSRSCFTWSVVNKTEEFHCGDGYLICYQPYPRSRPGAHPQAVCCGAEDLVAACPTTQVSHHPYLPPTPMSSKTVLAFDIYGTVPESSN